MLRAGARRLLKTFCQDTSAISSDPRIATHRYVQWWRKEKGCGRQLTAAVDLHHWCRLLGGGYDYTIGLQFDQATASRWPSSRPGCYTAAYVNQWVNMTAASGSAACFVTVTLMSYDKQSSARRTAVESKSNRSCNSRVNQQLVSLRYRPLLLLITMTYDIDENCIQTLVPAVPSGTSPRRTIISNHSCELIDNTNLLKIFT